MLCGAAGIAIIGPGVLGKAAVKRDIDSGLPYAHFLLPLNPPPFGTPLNRQMKETSALVADRQSAVHMARSAPTDRGDTGSSSGYVPRIHAYLR